MKKSTSSEQLNLVLPQKPIPVKPKAELTQMAEVRDRRHRETLLRELDASGITAIKK